MPELPVVRAEFGFTRTVCGCAFCSAHCRHHPGFLVPADLRRWCPTGQDLFAWAEIHLRARVDGPAPLLVPARQADGSCHWLFDGRCAVHADAPYGCAFFDAHMSDAEIDQRFSKGLQAVRRDRAKGGAYARIWRWLAAKGLVAPRPDAKALSAAFGRIRQLLR